MIATILIILAVGAFILGIYDFFTAYDISKGKREITRSEATLLYIALGCLYTKLRFRAIHVGY